MQILDNRESPATLLEVGIGGRDILVISGQHSCLALNSSVVALAHL